MSKLRRQISYRASLSTWLVTSVCSRSECTHSTVLYGSTHAEEICGHDQTDVTNQVDNEALYDICRRNLDIERPC